MIASPPSATPAVATLAPVLFSILQFAFSLLALDQRVPKPLLYFLSIFLVVLAVVRMAPERILRPYRNLDLSMEEALHSLPDFSPTFEYPYQTLPLLRSSLFPSPAKPLRWAVGPAPIPDLARYIRTGWSATRRRT